MVRNKGAGWIALMVLFCLTSCSSTPAAATLTDSELLQLVNDRYVEPFRRGDIDSWITVFHDDALALHNHRAADKGRAAIEDFGRMVHSLLILDRYDVRVTDIRSGPGWAYTAGVYESRFLLKSTGEEAWEPETGKFTLIWEQQPDGEWLIVLDMGNSSASR